MYTAVIIDDEEMARALLQGMVAEYCPEVEILETCSSLSSGVKAIRLYRPDIVFLDIEMPGHSGLELLDFFEVDEVDFSIIFVTAYNRYAIQAFKLSAIDYLLKPIEEHDLVKSIELYKRQQGKKDYKILQTNLHSYKKKIALHSVSSIQFVELDNLLFFQADGAYTKVFLKDGRQITESKSLKHFQNILVDQNDFLRCHKSFIVNLKHVTEYVKSDGGSLRVYQHEIGISPDKVTQLLEKLT